MRDTNVEARVERRSGIIALNLLSLDIDIVATSGLRFFLLKILMFTQYKAQGPRPTQSRGVLKKCVVKRSNKYISIAICRINNCWL